MERKERENFIRQSYFNSHRTQIENEIWDARLRGEINRDLILLRMEMK